MNRYLANADRNMAENLIVRLKGAIDSVQGLLDNVNPDDTAKNLIKQVGVHSNKLDVGEP